MQIRPARPSDAEAAAPLIALSMGGFGEAVLGLNDPARQLRALRWFFAQTGSRFSHDCSAVAEQNGQIVGILVAYPAAESEARNNRLARQMRGVYSLLEILQIVWLSLPALRLPEVFPGEFYTANLAVDPAWQGHGIGSALLKHAERLAVKFGLETCSLNVDSQNPRARALYERQGYRLAQSFFTPHLQARYHSSGFDHLVKPIFDRRPKTDE